MLMGPGFRQDDTVNTRSIQRRRLRDLQRAEEDRAVDKAQREGARLLAFEHGFLAERVDADGDGPTLSTSSFG